MDSTIEGSVNDNIHMDSTIEESVKATHGQYNRRISESYH
jgi:hypothetical protein